jgi:hypothetical protein
MIKPIADCPECLGQGYIQGSPGYKKCVCVYKQEAIEYLTPLYNVPGQIPKGFDVAGFARNLVFEAVVPERFRSFVKSFLLSSAMKYQHQTLKALDIIQAYVKPWSKLEAHPFSKLYDLDFLIINLELDPHNNFYGETMQSLIETRIQNKNFTWINSRYAIASDTFKKAYQTEFSYFLSKPPFLTAVVRKMV